MYHKILQVVNRYLNYHPTRFLQSAGIVLTRLASSEDRAFSDLFIPKYVKGRDWRSGLGDSHYLLYSIVRSSRPRVIVEIGSARGKSTCAMALACRQNGLGKVYAIDPHTVNAWTDVGVGESSYDFLTARLRDYGLESWCQIMPVSSRQAAAGWSKSIDLLFIDGDHTYAGVKSDFENFRSWLTEKALVAFHDSAWEYLRDNEYYREDMGVPKYMLELQRQGYHSITIDAPPGITLMCPRPGGFVFFPQDNPKVTSVSE